MSHVRHIAQRYISRLGRSIGVDVSRGALLLVSGGGGWAVDQIALSLREHLRANYEKVEVVGHIGQRPFVTQANIHFLCRPAFFDSNGTPDIHLSNGLVVSWLHGGRNSMDPNIVAACDQLEMHWRRVNRYIVPNSVTLRSLLECGVDPSIVHIIPNGVDTKVFTPAPNDSDRHRVRHELGIPSDAFVVGSFQRDGNDAGDPKMVKGPDVLVDTLAEVYQRRPIFVLLTGSGRTYVTRRLDELGVPYVHHWLSNPRELVSIYHAVDSYIISSREEGGPAPFRESMASGVPIVSTRMGLAADLVQNGVNGIVADVGDVQGLADGLVTLFDNLHLRRSLATEALNTVRGLDYSVIAQRYHDEVYRLAFA